MLHNEQSIRHEPHNKDEVVHSVRLNRGTISPAPLREVGQADAYI